jgi:hypothetical protein
MWEKPLTPFEIEVEEVKARMWDDDFDSVVEALPPMVITPLIDESTAKFVRTDDDNPSPPRDPEWVDGGLITHTNLARLAWCIKNQTLWNFEKEGLYMIKSIDVML